MGRTPGRRPGRQGVLPNRLPTQTPQDHQHKHRPGRRTPRSEEPAKTGRNPVSEGSPRASLPTRSHRITHKTTMSQRVTGRRSRGGSRRSWRAPARARTRSEVMSQQKGGDHTTHTTTTKEKTRENYTERRARLAVETVERWTAIVAEWPPMSDEQIRALAVILNRIDARHTHPPR